MNVAVVSHDAGTSELLCSLVLEHRDSVCWHLFAKPSSPMALICERYNLAFTPIGNTQSQLDLLRPDLLLFGTGWQERIELPYLRYCKTHGIPTVAFLDHWSSYRERFGYPEQGWEENLGDFTAVHDAKAYQIATSLEFPNVIALHNFHLQRLLHDAVQLHIEPGEDLLFLSEPTAAVAQKTYGDPGYWGFTQYSAFEEILHNFERFGCRGIVVRLHPSETSANYEAIAQRFPKIPVQINHARAIDLTVQLLSAKMILGFDTMALYIAALLGKPVLSYLPSHNRDFLLPLPPKRQLRDLENLDPSLFLPEQIILDDFGMDFASFLKTVTDRG